MSEGSMYNTSGVEALAISDGTQDILSLTDPSSPANPSGLAPAVPVIM